MTAINVDLDKYLRNFRIFYSKIVNAHPEQTNLQKKFKFLLENQTSKWRAGLFTNNIEDSANSIKSFITKTKSAIPKSTPKKQKHQWLLETQNFSRCFVFRSILTLLELKSKQGIKIIRAHLENDGALSQGKMFSGFAYRKISYAWSKIQNLFLSTFLSKPHAALGECINEFPQQFIDVLYDVFVDRKVPKLGLKNISEEHLETLSNLIRTNINFFQFENEKVTSVKKGGDNKKKMFIGYLAAEKIYVVAKEIPKKPVDDENQRKTLAKLSKMSSDLFRLYESDEVKLKNLDSVVATRPKGSLNSMQSSMKPSSPMTSGQSRIMSSTLQTAPRMGNRGSVNSRVMVNSSLHLPPKVSANSSRIMTNSTYGGLGRKNSLGVPSSYRGSSIMSNSRY